MVGCSGSAADLRSVGPVHDASFQVQGSCGALQVTTPAAAACAARLRTRCKCRSSMKLRIIVVPACAVARIPAPGKGSQTLLRTYFVRDAPLHEHMVRSQSRHSKHHDDHGHGGIKVTSLVVHA
jgi:hypothetical protein